MLEKEIHDFRYCEFKTDSDSVIRDLSEMMALGVRSKEISVDGEIVKKALPSMEYTWQIMNPLPDFTLVTNRKVTSFEEVSQEEYLIITEDQLSRVTNKATIRAKVLAQTDVTIDRINNNNHNAKDVYKYLQLYMPRYLCDTEVTDPFAQDRDATLIPKLLNPRTGRFDAIVRNYHWILLRCFDVPMDDYSNPLENKRDLITDEFTEFSSAPSEWTKLSWFTDFEEKYASEVHSSLVTSSVDKIFRVPVSASLTNKTNLSIRANFHPDRLVMNVVGNPNVDYGDNRYLISMAYIGSIDSFKGSKDDVDGNFGIFASSASIPSIASSQDISLGTFSGLNVDDQGITLPSSESWKVYNQTPAKMTVSNPIEADVSAYIDLGDLFDLNLQSVNPDTNFMPGETKYVYSYRKRAIPRNEETFSEGGLTSIDPSSIRVTFSRSSSAIDFRTGLEYGRYSVGSASNNTISVTIPDSDITSSRIPVTTNFISEPGSLVETIEVIIKHDDLYKFLYRYIVAEASVLGLQSMLVPGATTTQRIKLIGYSRRDQHGANTYYYNGRLRLGFNESGAITQTTNITKRDRYGNIIGVNYPATFGMHTANGTTDFAMYKTDSSDYWQSHFLMFSTSEQFMKKHMYGKSAYTGEYFADRIKVTHSAEGVRGVLSGLITVDAESLFAFDELIVNKDYEKYQDKAEETYIYIPITAGYCPFANSPNERNGIGLLKDVKVKDYNDNTNVNLAMDALTDHYIDSFYHFNDNDGLFMLDEINGLEVTWHCDDPVVFNPQEQELIEPTPEPTPEPEPEVISAIETKTKKTKKIEE